jgi:tetratricopeptide (TPR) repeat protein
MTPSKFEGGVVTAESLLSSDYLYYFQTNGPIGVSFVTLICSDFFNRPDGALSKIIDEVDFQILKRGRALDFLFNIQHNRSPDNELFLHGLRRIYDDGYKAHGDLCTIFLNAALDGDKGGRSKILFYKGNLLPERQPIKQLDAPVVGYELSGAQTLSSVHFKRLPRSWDNRRDTYPVDFTCYKFSEKQWTTNKDSKIVYLAPMQTEPYLDHRSYKELAERLSVLGRFDDSIHWAKKRLSHSEERKDFHEAALAALFMAIQFRHKGELTEALKHYAHAEAHILSLTKLTPGAALTHWRIQLGRIMVEDFMINGRCKQAHDNYQTFGREIDEYLSAHGSSDHELGWRREIEQIKLYKIHLSRQCAEMQRLLGRYKRARSLFDAAYKQYSYAYGEEKAYSALGCADSLRMMGRYSEAIDKYEEVREFATIKGQRRLLARVLRNRAEILRIEDAWDVLNTTLEELTGLSNETDYRFGKIYIPLIRGAARLRIDPKQAIEIFSQIESLVSRFSQNYLKVEFAHYLFGIAEARRLCGERESQQFYERAHKLYKETGVLWGIIRTSVGLSLVSNSLNGFEQSLKGLTISDPLDRSFIERAQQGKLDKKDILLLNIP